MSQDYFANVWADGLYGLFATWPKTPNHPANPATHDSAARFHLRNGLPELAAESAEEAAVLAGLSFSLLPGATARAVHNDPWSRCGMREAGPEKLSGEAA